MIETSSASISPARRFPSHRAAARSSSSSSSTAWKISYSIAVICLLHASVFAFFVREAPPLAHNFILRESVNLRGAVSLRHSLSILLSEQPSSLPLNTLAFTHLSTLLEKLPILDHPQPSVPLPVQCSQQRGDNPSPLSCSHSSSRSRGVLCLPPQSPSSDSDAAAAAIVF